jgi:hypothetical protein
VKVSRVAVSLIVSIILSGCGGSDLSGSQATSASEQSKQLRRTGKAQLSDYQTVVQSLYISYFGRPADSVGLANFEAALLADNAPNDIQSLNAAYATNRAAQTLVDSFQTSAESIALYGSGTTTAFVTAIYQNVLDRAPTTAGLNFWVGAINSGQLTEGDAALSIMAGALANNTAQGILDGQLITNRIAVAKYFTSQVNSQNAASAYTGPGPAASARILLSMVSATVNLATIENTVNTVVANLGGIISSNMDITLLAGNMGGPGNFNGAAARFSKPMSVATDNAGNSYVADTGNNTIRKITSAGVVSTLAGTPGVKGYVDGLGAAAAFNAPYGVATDSMGNVYVTDAGNFVIRKITPAGLVSTPAGSPYVSGYADGAGVAAKFSILRGIATDSTGNLYVSDYSVIRKITVSGVVSTLAGSQGGIGFGDGTGAAAGFATPTGVATDSEGNVYVADSSNCNIRKITPAGVVTTLAVSMSEDSTSDGTGSQAYFSNPNGIATDNLGNIYVNDEGIIRKITSAGVVTSIAGGGGIGTWYFGSFIYASNINYGGSADGVGLEASFSIFSTGLASDSAGNLYVADTNNNTIRKITPALTVSTLAGTAGLIGSSDGVGVAASFSAPNGLGVDSAGNVYVADTNNNTIRKITPAGVVSTVAGSANSRGLGNGTDAAASFNYPQGVTGDSAGNIYVADTFDNVIRKIIPGGVVSTFAGGGYALSGAGTTAGFLSPSAVATDSVGNVYVIDGYNMVRMITPLGVVTVFADSYLAGSGANGIGTTGSAGITVDFAGNVYVADTGNNTILKITQAGAVSTLAGKAGITGSVDGTGTAASFNKPQGIVTDGAGNVYVADTGNDTIREITPDGEVTTVIGVPADSGFVSGALPGVLSLPLGVAIVGKSLYITSYNGIVLVH